MQLVNGHVLFPHLANWENRPTWKRTWQNEVAAAASGAETRASMRACGRIALTWFVRPWTVQERAQLDDRIRAASKSGLACVPYWGRSSVVADQFSVKVFGLETGRPWKDGDWVFFPAADRLAADGWEVHRVKRGYGVSMFELEDGVSRTYQRGELVWPLIFGRFSADAAAIETGQRDSVELTIEEMISSESVQIGAVVVPVGSGIDFMRIGTTNIIGLSI